MPVQLLRVGDGPQGLNLLSPNGRETQPADAFQDLVEVEQIAKALIPGGR